MSSSAQPVEIYLPWAASDMSLSTGMPTAPLDFGRQFLLQSMSWAVHAMQLLAASRRNSPLLFTPLSPKP